MSTTFATVTEDNGTWTVALTLNNEPKGSCTCRSNEDAQSIADLAPLLETYYNQKTCAIGRIQRCMEALARNGYMLTAYYRQLESLAERSAKAEC